MTAAAPEPYADAPTVLTQGWHSQALGREKRVRLVLPPGRRLGAGPCPVLYLLHGYGGNGETWLRNTALLRYLAGMDLVVVLPESGRRWFINDHEGHRYEDYLVHELVPRIDRVVGGASGREWRAIAGFSMGGAAAVFQALRHPGSFAVAAALSGAFEAPRRVGDPYRSLRGTPGFLMPTVAVHERVWGAPNSLTRRAYDPYRLLERHRPDPPVALRLEVGAQDYERMVRMNRDVRQALRSLGVPHEYAESPGGHDFDFVDRALPATLAFVQRHLASPRSSPRNG